MNDFLKELEEVEVSKNRFTSIEMIFFAVTIGLIIFALGRGVYLRSDDTLIAYRAPDMREMGAPIRLERVESLEPKKIQNMLYDFTRQYIRALYPKNSKEAFHHYKYIVRHTKDPRLLMEYNSYLKDIKEVGRALDAGETFEFHPLNSLDTRMRKVEGQRKWVVEIDGFLNNRISTVEESRGIITMRLEIIYDSPSVNGSYSGWYVSKFETITIRDAVANNTEDIKKTKKKSE